MKILTGRTGLRRRIGVLAAVLGIVAAAAAPASSAAQATGSTATASTASESTATLDPAAIDRFVRDYMAQTRLPGAVVAVTRGDRVVHTAGYGHTASGKAMTAGTRVPVASLSKAMTALAVMQLVEAGKVDPDRPVHRYLPEFTMADGRAGKITVRQLLTQTSGMADSSYPDLTRAQPHSLREAVAAMREAPLAAEPGTRHRYHNPNYFVAARLVEVVSGQPFDSYLTERLFGPLGMTRTASVDTSTQMPDRARGYVRAYGSTVPVSHPRWFTAGGHGVVSTADDFAQWLIAQNNQGVSGDGRRIADAATLRATHTPPRSPDDTEYAMGWRESREDGEPRQLQHTGQLLTHNSMATLLPGSKVGIAVVTNTGMLAGDDAPQIVQGLVDLAEGRKPQVAEPFSMTADWVLAALTLLAAALGVRGTLRARRWARRTAGRPWWRVALRLLPGTLPILLLSQLAALAGLLMNRSGTLQQVCYAWPALVVCTATAALAATAVLVGRLLAALGHRRRTRATAPPNGYAALTSSARTAADHASTST
ncbi:class A beta-lactamase-related serine hydrolase [Streptomyces triticagri]|uniref:Class A beta-lactamase-related serine hydrolase n=1 Tax=Streptomyces triticagri TaxID=2293568 RepID=A0A372M512_9ACTN|nr:serine hydrolase domain-containing protein [Streptomyces triticagri]RFU86022.1 class A beta-lactamase-related serine hydrolase [Streptomyces triticagri]